MKVRELIAELQKYPPEFGVHVDVSASDSNGWEGDRVVRNVSGVRIQAGYKAVALDAYQLDKIEEARLQSQQEK